MFLKLGQSRIISLRSVLPYIINFWAWIFLVVSNVYNFVTVKETSPYALRNVPCISRGLFLIKIFLQKCNPNGSVKIWKT